MTSPISSRRVAMETQPQRIMLEVQARTVAKVLALVLAFSIVVSLLETVRTVIVWFGIALFLAVVLNPLVAFTERWMRRTIAVVVVFIGFVVGLLAVLAMLVGPFVTQIDNIVTDAPHAADRLAKNPLIHRLDEQYNIVDKAKEHASELPTVAFGAAGSVISGVTETVTVLFLSAFILFELPRMTEMLLSQMRPAGAHRAREIGAHINRSVGGYVVGNLFISVIAGVVATATVWVLGVPYALTLGVVVAIGDLVPLVGATARVDHRGRDGVLHAGHHRGDHRLRRGHGVPADREPRHPADRLPPHRADPVAGRADRGARRRLGARHRRGPGGDPDRGHGAGRGQGSAGGAGEADRRPSPPPTRR